MKKQKGKLIVIEGTDGSGKATQVNLLIDWLKTNKFDVKNLDFPQYGQPSAFFVEKYLRGEYGSLDEVGPYRGSLFYSLDRHDKSPEIRQWIQDGSIIVSNRYTSANMGHQAAKIDDIKKREKYLRWLETMEFKLLGIPKPHLTIFLYVPPEIGQRLVDQKSVRAYTKGKKRDIHEADLNHLKKASEAFLSVAEKYKWAVIDCTENGKLKTREEIHEDIKRVLIEKEIIAITI